ncbi:MAG: hypothetical protein KDC92_04980 [Bacteroidetes bacterium]|nr:hypothetical protein [Bacteroidota bacterium]
MKRNSQLVAASLGFSDWFYLVFDSLYPNQRTSMTNEQVARMLLAEVLPFVKRSDCKCDDIGYLIWDNDSVQFEYNFSEIIGEYWAFGYGLEKYVGPSDCFNFWLNNDMYIGPYFGSMEELSIAAFSKPIKQLDNSQLVDLIQLRMKGGYRSVVPNN